jgi:hypothetical protein
MTFRALSNNAQKSLTALLQGFSDFNEKIVYGQGREN